MEEHQQPNIHDVLNPRRALLAGLGGLAAGAFLAGKANAGPLTPPPGPIASTPGPEPRRPINALNTPGNASNTFRITQPGSYYLESNINGEAAKNGISIEASNVTIDLNGFSLLGPDGFGSTHGITNSGQRNNIIIRNGTVSNWPGDGINIAASSIGTNALIENVLARANGGRGIRGMNNCTIRACVAETNGTLGISVSANGVITACAVRSNGSVGIETGFGAVVTECSARSNNDYGLNVGVGSVVHACTSFSNTAGGGGILTSQLCIVTRCSACNNSSHGIQVGFSCLVAGNACQGNASGSSSGIRATGTNNRIEDNHCTSNAVGISVAAAGNFIARNTCRSNTTNWNIAANNACLVVNATLAAAFTGNSGGISPGSTNPNANFTF